jgi:hypothetical protein
MKKSTLVAIVTAFILVSGGICFAQTGDEQTGQMGDMMSGQAMMGHYQDMSNLGMKGQQQMMNRCPMGKGMMSGMSMSGMMSKSMVPTEDGGIVVMIGNKLYKYDKKLKLEKEAEVPVDYKGLKGMMMNMQNMGMGMNPEMQGDSGMAPSKDAKEK